MPKDSLDSLDPKLVEAWRKGGLALTIIGPLDPATATSLRHRMYRLRLRMRKLSHEAAGLADNATIIIRDNEDASGMVNLIILPSNMLIDQALTRAGITTGDPPPLD